MGLDSTLRLPRTVGSAVLHLWVPKAHTQFLNSSVLPLPHGTLGSRSPHLLPAQQHPSLPRGAPSTLAMSQTVTRGLSGTRSKQCTWFLTLAASVQSPHPKSATTSDAGLGQG